MTHRPLVGRALCDDTEASLRGFRSREASIRRKVLASTLASFSPPGVREEFQKLAHRNVYRWREQRVAPIATPSVRVIAGDWGEVTQKLTEEYGVVFAVLNMANAYTPGGAYVEGAAAQEENMYRRTDCHYYITSDLYCLETDTYYAEMTRLLSAEDRRVYLDIQSPRVCIKGPENPARSDLGYPPLSNEEVFPFYELRAAAQDLRGDINFDSNETRKRIAAQLDTLIDAGQQHVVLGAFGCGAFCNPSTQVASIYKTEISRRLDAFDCVAFAIRNAGYGPNNFQIFSDVFSSKNDNLL